VTRWPTPASCAASSLDDVLREWQGLGYPRRARALWLTAGCVTRGGWPRDEAGLRALPGVGVYTARALLAFSDLGAVTVDPPRDVNLGRVAARAALGREPQDVRPATLDSVLRDGRPASMPMREYSYALFDVGSIHCRARPDCPACPLRAACVWRARDQVAQSSERRQGPYHGSLRQLRGAVLRELLRDPQSSAAQLATAVHQLPGATPERIRMALEGLVGDGLISDQWALRS
jgi:A/G-specific adenine glycosylase